MKRRVWVYRGLVILVIFLGLASRAFAGDLPDFVGLYVGDGLWALMVFFGVGILFPGRESWFVGLVALIFCFGIEFSQLYQADWINALRANRLGALVLGRGFLWSDLLAYSVGVGFGVLVDRWLPKVGSGVDKTDLRPH